MSSGLLCVSFGELINLTALDIGEGVIVGVLPGVVLVEFLIGFLEPTMPSVLMCLLN